MDTTEHKGIYKRGNKLTVLISYNGRTRYFGGFSSMDEAIEARDKVLDEIQNKTIVIKDNSRRSKDNLQARIFWDNVKEHRMKLGLNQGTMAESLGIPRGTYQYDERSSVKIPTDKQVYKIAEILQTTPDKLMPSQEPTNTLQFPYPDEVIQWMNTKEGAKVILKAYMENLDVAMEKLLS